MYLSLNDRRRLSTNNSDVAVTDIGGVGEALLCYTDNVQCCNDTGQWFKQGEGDVGDVNGDGDLYVSRGLGVVRLHRRNNTFPSGVHCCEVPDAQSLNIRTCANIGGLKMLSDIYRRLFSYSLQQSTTTESTKPSEHNSVYIYLTPYPYIVTPSSSPPLNVRATQSSSSAPVEVSWSPPTDGANSITGYRIYYDNGQNVFVSSVTVITSVSLKVDGNYIGQNVSIRSEADQLYRELVNVSVVNGKHIIILSSRI